MIFLFSSLASFATGTDGPSVKTNLEVMQEQIADIAKETVAKSELGGTNILTVSFRNPQDTWVVQNAVLEALKEPGRSLFIGSTASEAGSALLELEVVNTKVSYGPTFRESFLGKRKSQRSIKSVVTVNLRSSGNEILFAGTLTRTATDTVQFGGIPDIENPAIKQTQGELPSEGFFDNIVEPMVIIGASAVAIYLFFTVRS